MSSPRDRLKPQPGAPPDAPRYSPIEWEYEQSDKRKYWVPCPHCGEYQVLRGRTRRGDTTSVGRRRRIERLLRLRQRLRYRARAQTGDVGAGEWGAEKPFAGRAGFCIWEAYSPFVTWGDMARELPQGEEETPSTQGLRQHDPRPGVGGLRRAASKSTTCEERREPLRRLFCPTACSSSRPRRTCRATASSMKSSAGASTSRVGRSSTASSRATRPAARCGTNSSALTRV